MFKPDEQRFASTEALRISYFELADPSQDAPVVLLLHGWPDYPHTWSRIARELHETGWRVLAPFLRGFGQTRFRSAETKRTGDPAALAQDALDLLGVLGVDRFAVLGHDWGARTAYTLACLAPERVTACIALSIGWGPSHQASRLSPEQIKGFWYQWFMSLERGGELLENPRNLIAMIWDDWCVARMPDSTIVDGISKHCDTADWRSVVLHYYRVRWGFASPDPKHEATDRKVADDPMISAPTLCLHGDADPCVHPSMSEGKDRFFSKLYMRKLLKGVGHFPHFEAPAETSKAIRDFLSEAV